MARATAYAAAYVGLGRRLGEGEEVRAETRLAVGAEHLLAEVFQRALQVAEGDALVYHQALALGELGQVRRVGNVTTVYFARGNDVNRQLLILHNMHLHAGGLGAQKHVGFAAHVRLFARHVAHVERVLHGTAGVVGRSVQRGEVVPVGFNLGAGCHGVAKPEENLGNLVGDGVDKVARAHLLGTAGQGDVDGIGLHARFKLGVCQLALLRFQRRFDLVAGSVYRFAHFSAMLLGNLAHGAQVAGKRTGLAHNLYADLLQRIGVRHFANSGKRIGMQGLDIVDN